MKVLGRKERAPFASPWLVYFWIAEGAPDIVQATLVVL